MQPTDPQDAPPHDALPPAGGPGRQAPAAVYAAIATVALLAIGAIVAVVATRDGGAEEDLDAAGAAGGLVGEASPTSEPSNAGSVRTTTTAEGDDGGGGGGGGEGDCTGVTTGDDLPEVTIPGEASPPTTVEGSDAPGWPIDIMSGEKLPTLGEIVVDLEEGGHQDFPVHLDADKRTALISAADDGRETEIEVFAPDGSSEGCWRNYKPGVVSGLEWVSSDRLPATGTYVVRVVHTGGSHEPFLIRIFADR